MEWLSSQGFISFIESGYGSVDAGSNLVDKLQAATSRSEDRYSILPAKANEPEVLTVPDSDGQVPGTIYIYLSLVLYQQHIFPDKLGCYKVYLSFFQCTVAAVFMTMHNDRYAVIPSGKTAKSGVLDDYLNPAIYLYLLFRWKYRSGVSLHL